MTRLAPLPFALALLLSGCGRSDPTHIWTLDPVPPPAPAVARAPALPVRVAAVHVPLTLDRLELVAEDSATRVTVRDFDRWSAPLGELMRAALTADLRARLPAGRILAASEPHPPRVRALTVDVASLRPTGEGWLLDGSWTLSPPNGAPPLRREVRLLAPATGTGAAAQASATTALVGQLADRIAAELDASPR